MSYPLQRTGFCSRLPEKHVVSVTSKFTPDGQRFAAGIWPNLLATATQRDVKMRTGVARHSAAALTLDSRRRTLAEFLPVSFVDETYSARMIFVDRRRQPMRRQVSELPIHNITIRPWSTAFGSRSGDMCGSSVRWCGPKHRHRGGIIRVTNSGLSEVGGRSARDGRDMETRPAVTTMFDAGADIQILAIISGSRPAAVARRLIRSGGRCRCRHATVLVSFGRARRVDRLG